MTGTKEAVSDELYDDMGEDLGEDLSESDAQPAAQLRRKVPSMLVGQAHIDNAKQIIMGYITQWSAKLRVLVKKLDRFREQQGRADARSAAEWASMSPTRQIVDRHREPTKDQLASLDYGARCSKLRTAIKDATYIMEGLARMLSEVTTWADKWVKYQVNMWVAYAIPNPNYPLYRDELYPERAERMSHKLVDNGGRDVNTEAGVNKK